MKLGLEEITSVCWCWLLFKNTSRALRERPFSPVLGCCCCCCWVLQPGVVGLEQVIPGSWSRLWDFKSRDPLEFLNFPSNSLNVGLLSNVFDPTVSVTFSASSEPGLAVTSELVDFLLLLSHWSLVRLLTSFFPGFTRPLPDASNIFDFLNVGLFDRPGPVVSKMIRFDQRARS